jgi:two-component system chemotaxis response regulator CheB
VRLARSLRTANLVVPQQQRPPLESVASISEPPRAPVTTVVAARNIVAIASSTGGPTALMEIFARLPERSQSAMLIAQHMPDKFTRTFAERLNKRSSLRVTEAQDMDQVGQGFAFVCPGRRCMEVEVMPSGNTRLRVVAPTEADRYVPSADRLFASVAKVAGSKAVGVILTGMGDDGVQGARAILAAGGMVIAESERTAVVYGMPGAAVRAMVVTRSLALPEIGDFLADLAS